MPFVRLFFNFGLLNRLLTGRKWKTIWKPQQAIFVVSVFVPNHILFNVSHVDFSATYWLAKGSLCVFFNQVTIMRSKIVYVYITLLAAFYKRILSFGTVLVLRRQTCFTQKTWRKPSSMNEKLFYLLG